MYLFKLLCFFFSDVYPGVGLLGHMVVLFLVFWEASVLFSSVAALICTLTDNLQGFLLLQFLTNVCYLFSFLMIGCFHVLAIANSAAVNVRVHVSFHISVFIFLNCIPRSRIAGLYGSSIFSFSLSFFKYAVSLLIFYHGEKFIKNRVPLVIVKDR